MTTIAAATTPALIAEIPATEDAAYVKLFLRRWDEAWARHDAEAIAALHTDDAVTVNRFGTLVRGRDDLGKALGFLHGVHGPFHNSVFPPLELLIQRSIAPNVQAVQAKWQNPVMRPDGTIDPASINDMIVTFILLKIGNAWRASEVNLVNVEKMDLPFSNPGQRPK
ncbi:YybH family protein [Granulicella sibirica]|nr:nuclear transport factor 2 family protein [Granulicella sibirica]